MNKLPYFPFYPGDYLRGNISGCTHEAQCLWLRLLILMHDSPDYGRLSVKDQETGEFIPIPDKILAKKTGFSQIFFAKFLKELIVANAIKIEKSKILFCARMVKIANERTTTAKRQEKHRKHNAHITEESRQHNANITPIYSYSDSTTDSSSKNKETIKEKKSGKFLPPTIQEAEAYFAEIRKSIFPENYQTIQAEKFFNFYESKGWAVGKQPMKNWKAACRNWNASDEERLRKNPPPTNTQQPGKFYKLPPLPPPRYE